jgi:hypothetical protein
MLVFVQGKNIIWGFGEGRVNLRLVTAFFRAGLINSDDEIALSMVVLGSKPLFLRFFSKWFEGENH